MAERMASPLADSVSSAVRAPIRPRAGIDEIEARGGAPTESMCSHLAAATAEVLDDAAGVVLAGTSTVARS